MAITLLEGFDDGLWMSRIGGTRVLADVSASYGLNGNGLQIGDTVNRYATVPVTDPAATNTFGCAFKVNATPTTSIGLIKFKISYFELRFDTNRIQLFVNASATPDLNLYSAVGSVALGEWHYVEVEWLHDATSAGTLKWWLDGVLLDSETGIDYTINQQPTTIQIGGTDFFDVDDWNIDNIYLLDNSGSANTSALGPIEVATLLPNGNGNSSVLVGSDADSVDNYLLVDNNASTPPATTEYVGSSVEGDKDTYAMADLTGTPAVKGIVTSLYAQKTDSGAKFIRSVVRAGSTDYPGASVGLAESFSLHEETWDENPNTALPWTAADINALEVGQEVRDS